MICIYSPDFARRLVCHQGLPLSLVTSHVLAMKSARGGCLKKDKVRGNHCISVMLS